VAIIKRSPLIKPITFLSATLFLLLGTLHPLPAQAPDTLCTRTYGGSNHDWGYSVQQTGDGGFVVAGLTESFGAGERDAWLIRTDAQGDTLWTRTFGGSNHDWGYSVQQTADGGFVVAGYTESFGAGERDAWMIRTDTRGDTLWTRTYGGSSFDEGYSVQETSDSGFVVVGYTGSFGAGVSDVWLIRTDAEGDTLWTRTFGGINSDRGSSVQQINDGGYILTGTTASFGAGGADVWLLRTDANGDTLWTRTYGGSGDDQGYSVQQTSDGCYIICSHTYSFGAGSYDVWLIKTDANGDTLWTRTYGGSGNDYGRSVQQTSDGGFVVAGYTYSFGVGWADVWLIRTDAEGDTLWTRTFGGINSDGGSSVQQINDGGYILTGTTASFGAGSADVWLIRLTPEAPIAIEPKGTQTPAAFALSQNYPNPFNPITTIRFALPRATAVRLVVYDIQGREVARLVDGDWPAGYHRVVWDGRDATGREMPTGLYIARLLAPGYVKSIKLVLLR